MTEIGVGIGVVCLALGSYVSAHARASQKAPAKQTVPDQSSARRNDKSTKEGAANDVKVVKKVTVNVVFAGDTKFVDAVKGSCDETHADKLQDCFAAEMK